MGSTMEQAPSHRPRWGSEDGSMAGALSDGVVSTVDDLSVATPRFQGVHRRRSSRIVNTSNDGAINTMDEHEKKRTLLIKACMLVVFLAALFGMSVGAYKYVEKQENHAFETDFHNMAREVIALASKNIRGTFDTTDLFSASISSTVASSNMSWPYVNLPHYGKMASRAHKMSQAQLMMFASIVEDDEKADFENFMRANINDNTQNMIDYQGLNMTYEDVPGIPDIIMASKRNSDGSISKVEDEGPGPYLVKWHMYPFVPSRFFVGNNVLAHPANRNAFANMLLTRAPTTTFTLLDQGVQGQVFQPIYDYLDNNKIVGVVWMIMFWEHYFTNIVPIEAKGNLQLVLKSSCGFETSYVANSTHTLSLGDGDLHDPRFDAYGVKGELFRVDLGPNVDVPDNVCVDRLTLDVYPTDGFRNSYQTSEPALFAGLIVGIFVICFALFLLYDWAVNQRQLKILMRLQKQDRIVADIFPEQIMARLYENEDLDGSLDGNSNEPNDGIDQPPKRHDPIADLYLDSTIMYSDICGFTAWSSQREPPQVFTLLEHLYSEFDKLARRYSVFKVESIGDVYIAATGVPDSDPNHCVNMARFARKCLAVSSTLMKHLETKLGPDTGDLEVRIGIHSGQVTAGVLRGDRARFQLFGETVNTAEQLLKNGQGQKIHISESVAKLLSAAGKSSWVIPNGNGTVGSTHWLEYTSKRTVPATSRSEKVSPMMQVMEQYDDEPTSCHEMEDYQQFQMSGLFATAPQLTKTQRLVEWNVEVLTNLLRQVMAARHVANGTSVAPPTSRAKRSLASAEMSIGKHQTVLEEFQEIIKLPNDTVCAMERQRVSQSIAVPEEAKEKLRHLVSSIAGMYRDNPFHNFEHASHVTASVVKMLKRITDTDAEVEKHILLQNAKLDGNGIPSNNSTNDLCNEEMAVHSYGITSDPLTQFAVVFCSIIHDADHPGVTNAVLVKEDTYLSRRYKQKSVAEQNSVDLVWSLLMAPEYAALRECIYTTEDELRRFRQIIVNIVMATDICDKELGALRKNRWNVAFAEDAIRDSQALKSDMDRKATIVLEHLIQASDVSHTMQHWNIFLLWNEKLFREMHRAYKEGRMDSDPTNGWYKGEMGFFDFYIIPLAKKLESCGVFGVSSAEYLEYAVKNRRLWEDQGEGIVMGYVERLRNADDQQEPTSIDELGVVL